jgi:hypothetical protein
LGVVSRLILVRVWGCVSRIVLVEDILRRLTREEVSKKNVRFEREVRFEKEVRVQRVLCLGMFGFPVAFFWEWFGKGI